MKHVLNSNWIYGIGVARTVLIIGGGIYKWNQQKIEYQKSQVELAEISKVIPDQTAQIRKAYSRRNYFILYLLSNPKLKDSIHAQALKSRLQDAFKQMEANDLQTTDQLTRFEQLAAYTNQLMTDEVLKLNRFSKKNKEKSILFSDQKQVRELERIDLAIDYARKTFAQTSWKLLQEKSKMEKNWNHKNPVTITPYFPADVMVVEHQKKSRTKVL